MTVFDEDYTDDDMAAALGWALNDRMTCDCGLPSDETTAVGRDGKYDAELIQCHACAVRDRKLRAYQRDKGDMAGIRTRVWEIEED